MKKTTGVLATVCLCLALALSAQAGTITVTSTDDSGPGSLRQAIADAQPGDEILFEPSSDGQVQRIILSSPLSITKGLTIVRMSINRLLRPIPTYVNLRT